MNWKLWRLDVKNTFLCGELDREVFIEQPKGYVSMKYPCHVFRLKKVLYDLKQHHVLGMVKFSNTLFFVALKFLMQILVYLLNQN